MTDQLEPTTRNEASYRSFRSLNLTGANVKKRGCKLLLSYAGTNAKTIAVSYLSGKAAKRGQTLLRRDLRAATSDAGYNRVLDAYLRAIVDAQVEREEVAGQAIEQAIEQAPEHAITYHHVHDCYRQDAGGKCACGFSWEGHDDSLGCPCAPVVNGSNYEITGEVFIIHRVISSEVRDAG